LAAAVSPSLAWIGSPCLRHCVHGAPIGGLTGGGDRTGGGADRRRLQHARSRGAWQWSCHESWMDRSYCVVCLDPDSPTCCIRSCQEILSKGKWPGQVGPRSFGSFGFPLRHCPYSGHSWDSHVNRCSDLPPPSPAPPRHACAVASSCSRPADRQGEIHKTLGSPMMMRTPLIGSLLFSRWTDGCC
jgi:hypothetical protein